MPAECEAREPVPRATACTRDACGPWSRIFRSSRNSGMTGEAIHHECGEQAWCLSPRTWPVFMIARRCLRRDVHASVFHVAATGAWKESLSEGSRSRRPAVTVAVEAPAMARSAATAEEAHGRKAADLQRDTNRRHAGAARQPGDPPRVSGSPTGFPGRPARGLPGRLGAGPGLPMRRPRDPSHLRGVSCGADGV